MNIEAIIVLGHESKEGKISELCCQRLKRASRLYLENKVPVILSGGYSLKSKKGIGTSEAELMEKEAIKLGIDKKDIILEKESRDTQANAYYTKQIIKQKE